MVHFGFGPQDPEVMVERLCLAVGWYIVKVLCMSDSRENIQLIASLGSVFERRYKLHSILLCTMNAVFKLLLGIKLSSAVFVLQYESNIWSNPRLCLYKNQFYFQVRCVCSIWYKPDLESSDCATRSFNVIIYLLERLLLALDVAVIHREGTLIVLIIPVKFCIIKFITPSWI